MATPVHSRKDKRYGIAEQSTWGTAVLPSVNLPVIISNFGVELCCDDTTIERDVKIREFDQAHGYRFGTASELSADTKGSMPSITFAGDVRSEEIARFLYAWFQNVTEEEASPFKKTFTPFSTQPDFTNAGGFYMTVFERFLTASQSTQIRDCVAQSLKFSWGPGQNLRYESKLVGRGAPVMNSNPSGTWTTADDDLFAHESLYAATYNTGGGATNMILTGPCEINLNYAGLAGVGHGSDTFTTWALAKPELTFSLTILDDEAARTALQTAHAAGTQTDFVVQWSTTGTVGATVHDFGFTWSGKMTECNVENADVQGVKVSGKILGDDSSTAGITIVMADAIDMGW